MHSIEFDTPCFLFTFGFVKTFDQKGVYPREHFAYSSYLLSESLEPAPLRVTPGSWRLRPHPFRNFLLTLLGIDVRAQSAFLGSPSKTGSPLILTAPTIPAVVFVHLLTGPRRSSAILARITV